ncbi:MAG: DUF1116 domain-containing protein [Geodermatophilaceae bacterium]|nr:DUF1116 domain-containing protein [Geodermatophilaceae bacterium]
MTRPLAALLTPPLSVVTAGVDLFPEALRGQGVEVDTVDWRPPAFGAPGELSAVAADPRRVSANRSAAERILAAGAELVDVQPAGAALGLSRELFLHAGPPIEFAEASGPLRGALIGAALFEELAGDPDEAVAMLASGRIRLEPCHHHRAVGPMAGVTTASMWVSELRDPVNGGSAFCSLNEGLGKVLRYGAYSTEVIERLRWMGQVLGPVLAAALARSGPIDIKSVLAQMLQMGDEGHNRNRAGSLMFLRDLAPAIAESGASADQVAEVLRFLGGNEHFFLNYGMPAAKLAMDAARDIPGSSVVVAMARNGTDFGIQTSGTGDAWFTAPALTPEGLFLGAYGPDDANPDIGDSAIMETLGVGGFSMAAAPAIVRFVGGTVPDALATTRRMYDITVTENPAFAIPVLEFRGAPTGIDVLSVARTGILPQINTGMAGRVAGTGQVGAGLVKPPQECFEQALTALAQSARTRAENPALLGLLPDLGVMPR